MSLNRIKDEHMFNVLFVKLIERYKCLYDNSIPEYNIKSTQDEAWREIARKVGDPEMTCKERWRNIRCSYVRYLSSRMIRSKVKPAKPTKPYYLTYHLRFLRPFAKPRLRKSPAPFSRNDHTYVVLEKPKKERKPTSPGREIEFYIDNPLYVSTEEHGGDLEDSPPSLEKDHSKSEVPSPSLHFETDMENTVEYADPSDKFVQEILPELRLLTPQQKKMAIMQIRDIIADEDRTSGNVDGFKYTKESNTNKIPFVEIPERNVQHLIDLDQQSVAKKPERAKEKQTEKEKDESNDVQMIEKIKEEQTSDNEAISDRASESRMETDRPLSVNPDIPCTPDILESDATPEKSSNASKKSSDLTVEDLLSRVDASLIKIGAQMELRNQIETRRLLFEITKFKFEYPQFNFP